jgi:hypothetical protein
MSRKRPLSPSKRSGWGKMKFLEDSKFVKTISVDVGQTEPVEVDVFEVSAPEPKFKDEFKDPFLRTDLMGLPQTMKRRATRLMKRDENDAKSKANEEERITGYDILRVVPPPYNLDMLAQLYEQNSAHNAAATMKATNIVGLGYRWVEKPRTRLEEIEIREDRPRREA